MASVRLGFAAKGIGWFSFALVEDNSQTGQGRKGFLGFAGALDAQAGQFPCPQEDSGEHSAVETASVGVAQRRVIGGEEMKAVGEQVVRPVGEAIVGFSGNDAGV